ncbi:MAG TPA: SprB repeat-containing protein, partial [Bacteroidia bacterium]|nr:SprB repeat-containing protein [Bacteroidia bacterium]
MKKLVLFPIVLLLGFLLVLSRQAHAQASACPAVTTGTVAPVCSGQCVNLTATVQGTLQTNTYTVSGIPYSPYPYTGGNSVLINIDDTWSPVINMPFCFQFFGNTYNQIVIGSNAIVTFDVTQANGYCQWPINNAIPSNANPMNSIMAPWHDIDPSVGTPTSATDVNWQVFGSAPCREFVISWNDVAMFDCNNLIATSQLVLHESTNIIDIYIQNKPLCSTWNGGAAIEGIQDATGSTAFVVPGRNYPTQWTASNDGQRFMPAGTPNYTLQWTGPSGPVGTTATVNVCPTATTTYTCTVTNTSCSGPIVVSATETVTVGGGITTSGTQSNSSSCTACNGSATVSITSGTGPFSYSWSPTGGSAATASGLCPGTYTCTISNTAGCNTTQTFSITGPSNPTSIQSSTNVSCNGGCNGTGTITPSPAGAYTYAWSPTGGSAATASGLCAGTYTVTATNAGGCTTTQTITITQPPALTTTSSQTNVTCNGGNNGSATVNPSGGTGPYSYSWAPNGGTGATANGLTAQGYTCTITDAAGCTITQAFNITQPSPVTASVSTTPSTCSGNNGTATVNPSGGTGPYTYSWAPAGGTGVTASSLGAGSYTCTVTDAAGCTVTATGNVASTGGITATVTATTNVSCNGGSNGSATAAPTGGVGPYTYSWSPSGGNGTTASGLGAGSYTCTVTDANGCIATTVATITEPTALSLTSSQVDELCNGGNTGSATVNISGGTSPYSYSWSPSGGNGATA